jgi:hypothetical protein
MKWWLAWVLVGACDTRTDLLVDVRSEVDPTAVDRVVSTLDGIALVERPIAPTDDLAGLRAAEFDDVALGLHEVRACLHAGSVVVGCASREVRLAESAGVTLDIAADCAALGCPVDTACASGRCESLECEMPADCTPPVACARPTCTAGSCTFAPDDALCDSGGRCDLRAGCLDAPAIVVEGAASLPSGGAIPIAIRAVPPESWDVGTTITVRASAGVLEQGSTSATEATLVLDAARMFPPVSLVARGVPEGAEIELTSESPLTGTTRFTIEAARLGAVDVEGASYDVLSGYLLDAPLTLTPAARMMLTGAVEGLAIPSRETTVFDAEAYVSIRTAGAPQILRSSSTGDLEVFATATGMMSPDEHARNMVFAPNGAGYGDRLVVCSESPIGGDGSFLVDPMGRFSELVLFNNCQGLAFDLADRLGAFGAQNSLYAVRQVDDLVRVSSTGAIILVGTGLPVLTKGHRLTIPQAGRWIGSALLLSEGADETLNDGAIHRIDDVGPWSGPVLVRGALPEPKGGVAGADASMPDLFFVILATTGELVAFSEDGSYVTIVRGLQAPEAIALDSRGSAIWIAEGTRGQVLRVRTR